MFHSVGLEKSDWYAKYLSVPFIHLKEWLAYLNKSEYEAYFLDEWYNNFDRGFIRNDKKLILTFDDGYLDNWVYLFPLLEKFGIKATIFINPEFIEPFDCVRPNINDVWEGRISEAELETKGFLNWEEIQKMYISGLVDIQSHSMSHNWYFRENDIVDFFDPQESKYFWLPWIYYPEKKPFYMRENLLRNISKGYPVFKFGRSLGIRRYFPDEELIKFSEILFQKTDISKVKALEDLKNLVFDKGSKGRLETDEEMIKRYEYELEESKKIIEQKLNKKVDFLCWPGGVYNELSVAISIKAGYKASTLSSKYRNFSIDNGGYYKRIQRFSIGVNINYKDKTVIDPNPKTLLKNFREFEGKIINKYNRWAKKIFYIAFK